MNPRKPLGAIDWAAVAAALTPHLEPNGALYGCGIEVAGVHLEINDVRERLVLAWWKPETVITRMLGSVKIESPYAGPRRTLNTSDPARIATSVLEVALVARTRLRAEKAARLRVYRVERAVAQALAESHPGHVDEVSVDAERDDGLVCVTLAGGTSLVCVPERAGEALEALVAFRTARAAVREPMPEPEAETCPACGLRTDDRSLAECAACGREGPDPDEQRDARLDREVDERERGEEPPEDLEPREEDWS